MDNDARVGFLDADGFGFDTQHNQLTFITNDQGDTNQVIVLGDTNAGTKDSTLFGIAVSPDAGSNWTQILHLDGAGNLDLNGGVSGSSTSTGSFGRLSVGGAVNNGTVDIVGPSGGLGELYIYDVDNGTATTDGFYFAKSSNNTFIINKESGGDFQLGTSNVSSNIVMKSGAVANLLTLDGNKISGSATSTGSFGDGRFIGKVAIFGSGSKTPDTPLHIRGDFDGSDGLPNTNPNKGLNISKFTGLQSDYGKGDKFGITFTAASNAATDYALAGIYGQVTNVSSYVGGSIIFATRLETENALTAKMAISSSGNVGIGVTTPSQRLEVAGAALINNGTSNHHLYFGNTSYGIHVVHSTGVMNFVSNTSTRLSISNGGHVNVTSDFLPTSDNSSNLGSSSKRWANIHSADLHLSNEGTGGNDIDGTEGNWTIQEGEQDLYLLNNKNGKKYRFKLEEIR